MKPLHPFEDWQLSAYASGDLEPGDRKRLDTHLATCPECAERLREFRLVTAALGQLPKLSPSRDLWPGISAFISPPLMAVPGGHPFEDWQLSAALDGDLEPAEQRRLSAHLSECVTSRARMDDLRGMLAALGSMPALKPSPFLWTRIQAGLGRGGRRALGGPGYWFPAGLAAAAALVVVLMSSPRHGPLQQAASTPHVPAARVEHPAPAPATSNLASLEPAKPAASSEVRPEAGAPVRTPAHGQRAAAVSSTTQLASTAGSSPAGGAASQDGAVTVDPDPSITAAIRAHLDELDATINDTQKNLALNPGNERVQAAAWSAYMAKVEYLRSILTRTPSAARNRSSYGPSAAAIRSAA
jgi:anti-sigma factor RsiW